jgi:hypothetical protein
MAAGQSSVSYLCCPFRHGSASGGGSAALLIDSLKAADRELAKIQAPGPVDLLAGRISNGSRREMPARPPSHDGRRVRTVMAGGWTTWTTPTGHQYRATTDPFPVEAWPATG